MEAWTPYYSISQLLAQSSTTLVQLDLTLSFWSLLIDCQKQQVCLIMTTPCQRARHISGPHDNVILRWAIDDFQVSTITMGNTHAVFVW